MSLPATASPLMLGAGPARGPAKLPPHVDGSADELARLYWDHRPALVAFFRRRVRNATEVDDLAQEMFIRVVSNSRQSVIARPEAYLFQVAANLLRDRARAAKVRDEYASGAALIEERGVDVLDPHRVVAGREVLELLTVGLDHLPQRTREIFLLFRYERIGKRTIAESYGISVSAVEKHVYRAMARLIEKTGGCE